jgi:hypothetical protein
MRMRSRNKNFQMRSEEMLRRENEFIDLKKRVEVLPCRALMRL